MFTPPYLTVMCTILIFSMCDLNTAKTQCCTECKFVEQGSCTDTWGCAVITSSGEDTFVLDTDCTDDIAILDNSKAPLHKIHSRDRILKQLL